MGKAYPMGGIKPTVHISPDRVRGFLIAVGFYIDKHWYECRTSYARTERGARRRARQLTRWYEACVRREERADALEEEMA